MKMKNGPLAEATEHVPPTIDAIPRLFRSRWHRHYAASKLRTDPLYEAVWAALRGTDRPLLDVGCGVGLFAFYLRARGFEPDIVGIDYDARKVDEARGIAARHFSGITFREGDARDGIPGFAGSVTVLDLLQFFQPDERAQLLAAAARSVAPGGVLVVRSGVRDDSWRCRVTRWADIVARLTRWMKAMPIDYPTIGEVRHALEREGLAGEVRPLWGNTPFNNYIFVFRREGGHSADERAGASE